MTWFSFCNNKSWFESAEVMNLFCQWITRCTEIDAFFATSCNNFSDSQTLMLLKAFKESPSLTKFWSFDLSSINWDSDAMCEEIANFIIAATNL